MPPEKSVNVRVEPTAVLTADYQDAGGESRTLRLEFEWTSDGGLTRRFKPHGAGAVVPTSVATQRVTETVRLDDEGLLVRAAEEESGLFLLVLPFKDRVEFDPVRLRRTVPR